MKKSWNWVLCIGLLILFFSGCAYADTDIFNCEHRTFEWQEGFLYIPITWPETVDGYKVSDIYAYLRGVGDYSSQSYDLGLWSDTTNLYVYSPEPGLYSLQIKGAAYVDAVTIAQRFESKIDIVILEKDGSVPDYSFAINNYSDVSERTIYAVEGKVDDCFAARFNFGFAQGSTFFDFEGEELQWILKLKDGAKECLGFYNGMNNTSFVTVMVDESELEPGDYVYDVVCSYHGETHSEEVVIHVLDAGVGEWKGIGGLPESMEVVEGESFTVNPYLLPEGWMHPTISAHLVAWIGKADTMESVGEVDLESGVVTGMINTPGEYILHVRFYADSLNYPGRYDVRKDIPVTVLSREEAEEINKPRELDGEYTLMLPEDIARIETHAFAGISAAAIIIPEGCVSIESYAFADCNNLLDIVIPASVTELGEDILPRGQSIVIHAPAGSPAASYAKDHGFRLDTESNWQLH